MKAVSDIVAPLSGEVLAVNEKVVAAPETVNDDPYGEGWLIRIRSMSTPASSTRCWTRRRTAPSSPSSSARVTFSLTDADRAEMLAAIGVGSPGGTVRTDPARRPLRP